MIRQKYLSTPLANFMRKRELLPTISPTERIAIDAGTAWVDAELYSGKPDFARIRSEPFPKILPEEQAFLEHQVNTVCGMVSDWQIYQNADLPPAVWDYLKQERFFGMIIPKEHGGLGFSALGHSEVIAKLTSHSTTLGVTVMVPNSLGPAELLLHYGTPEQKAHYLPRLARGEEIPCFALTEPEAGSDADAIQSSGRVLRGEDGRLYVSLDWDKRYITLAPIATLIGLAVKLNDPQNLLGKGVDVGITCVLVPADAPGVAVGRRHNPMGVPFQNGPTTGHDVLVPIEQIIGGVAGAGRGWQMLMECLAAGRGISLPSQSVGGTKKLLRTTSAYAAVRRQFGVPIGAFEGIGEPLARIVGIGYLMDATRRFTLGAIDSGKKPAVVTAIAKYNETELARKIANDGMDIMGGAGIVRGPRNLIANGYIGMAIGITVEGANILTRSMIIFGQGALRCHPYAYKEVKALGEKDDAAFDKAFWGHVGHVFRNAFRSFYLSLSRGYLARVPRGVGARYYRRIAWASASFAIMADIAMAAYGGRLRRKETLTGHFADLLSWMYLATATLRRFEAEGCRDEHRDVFDWAMRYCMVQLQEAFTGLFANFSVPGLSWLFRGPLAFWSRMNSLGAPPSDAHGQRLAKAIQKPGTLRDSLTTGIYLGGSPQDPGVKLERAFTLAYAASQVLSKIKRAVKAKRLPKKRPTQLVDEALTAGVITEAEARVVAEANEARAAAIAVDSFPAGEYRTVLMETKPTTVIRRAGAATSPEPTPPSSPGRSPDHGASSTGLL